MAFYDGFENVIVYPVEFVPLGVGDEAGSSSSQRRDHGRRAMPGGPVVLSWPDVAAAADWLSTGMNLVIHEFAHKIDMRNGEANGARRCRPNVGRRLGRDVDTAVRRLFALGSIAWRRPTSMPMPAESPAEFFAVLSGCSSPIRCFSGTSIGASTSNSPRSIDKTRRPGCRPALRLNFRRAAYPCRDGV